VILQAAPTNHDALGFEALLYVVLFGSAA